MRKLNRFCFSFFVVVCLAGLSQSTFAQDDPDTDPPPATAGVDNDGENAGNDVAQKEVITPSGERIIYVPFKNFEGVFEDPEANVVLPYAEYQRLLKAWQKRNDPPGTPAAVINSADYVVKIDGDLARISATLKLTVLGKPWVWFAVKFGDASISKASGDNVLLQGVGPGEYRLFFDSKGEKTVQLELAVPVTQSPDGREFVLNVPHVGISTVDITVPRKDQTIEVTPKVVELPLGDVADNVTRIKANIGATNQIKVRWSPKTTLKPEMNLLSSVSNQTLVNLEDGLIHTDTWLNYEILRGSMSECRIVVPASHRILDVTASARIKNWKVDEQDGQQIVTVEFLTEVEKPVTVEVHTEHKLPDDGVYQVAGKTDGEPATGIHALDVVRESGQLAIRHSNDYAVNIVDQRGVVRIEEAEVAPRLKGNNRLTFKFYTADLALSLNAQPVQPRLLATHQINLTFQDDELRALNTINYTIEKAGVFEVKLKIPDELKVDTVVSPRMKEYNIDEDSQELTITLLERTQGSFAVNITSHRDLTESETELSLPIIEPLGVERETGAAFVYAKDSIEVITDQDALEGVQPLPVNQDRRGNVSLNSAWNFSRRPVTIPVRTKRKPTRLSAKVGTVIDVQPELTKLRTQLDYVIEYSGVDTFRLEVPESVSKDISIEIAPGDQQSAPIKQRTAAEAEDGWVTWTVVTQREVLGNQRFIVSYDLKGDAAEQEEDEPKSSSVQLIRPLGLVDDDGNSTTALSNVQGEVVVQKERSLSLSAQANGGGIELIDLRELKTLPQNGTLAYRYFSTDQDDRATINIIESRHEIQEVVSTVVSRGLVEIVTGEDTDATYRARFHVKTSERQRLLVHLPVNLEVLGTYLNDREVKLEKAQLADSEVLGETWTPFWVNVARTESSEQPFLLTFQFLWRVNPSLGESTFGRGRMSLPLPVIGEGEDSVAQELKVVVWVPEKYSLIGDPNDFQLQTLQRAEAYLLGEKADRETSHLDDWVAAELSSPAGVAQFPTEGRVPYVYSNLGGAKLIKVKWWNHVVISIIMGIAIGLIGWVLLRTSWENKLGMLLIAAFAAALFGLTDSHALSQGLYSARFGLLLLIALWLLHGIFTLLRAAKSSIVVGQPTTATVSTGAEEFTATTESTDKPSTPSDTENDPPDAQE